MFVVSSCRFSPLHSDPAFSQCDLFLIGASCLDCQAYPAIAALIELYFLKVRYCSSIPDYRRHLSPIPFTARRWKRIHWRMVSSKGHVQSSCDAEDSQAEIFNKRKAPEYLKYGLPKSQLSHQDSKEDGRGLSETSSDFPQKKPKLASPQYRCDFNGVYEEYDM